MKWMQFLTPAKSMDFKETQAMIAGAAADEITILDVRQPNEYRQSHIPGATLIPLPELGDRLGEIDPEKPVLVY
jgi:rhodanese-related sulfurtransferase